MGVMGKLDLRYLLDRRNIPVWEWEQKKFDEFVQQGSKIPIEGDKDIHEQIRECSSADDLKELVKNIGGLSQLDNRSLALIIEGSGCANVIAAYVDYANLFVGNIEELLSNSEFLLNSAKFVFTTPEFSKEAQSQFRGGSRNSQWSTIFSVLNRDWIQSP